MFSPSCTAAILTRVSSIPRPCSIESAFFFFFPILSSGLFPSLKRSGGKYCSSLQHQPLCIAKSFYSIFNKLHPIYTAYILTAKVQKSQNLNQDCDISFYKKEIYVNIHHLTYLSWPQFRVWIMWISSKFSCIISNFLHRFSFLAIWLNVSKQVCLLILV